MKSILIYRIGSLGDTLVALPAMWALREQYPEARITLLCDQHIGRGYVLAADVLRGCRAIDDVMTYPVTTTRLARLFRPARMAGLALRLRRLGFDAVAYLAPALRAPSAVARDRRFFRMAGIRNFLGMEGFDNLQEMFAHRPLPTVPHEADALLHRLKISGVSVPSPQHGRMELSLGPDDHAQVKAWLSTLPSDGGRPWIALGPGSKMPAKVWPAERYRDVVLALLRQFDVWPVTFGGEEDREVGRQMLEQWGRGYNAAGALGVRQSAAAMTRCRMYLGNDTGTMHMAAAVGVRCVAVFSSRTIPGKWYPYGQGHVVFRTPIDCEGCELLECIERKMECLMTIGTAEVTEAAGLILTEHRR